MLITQVKKLDSETLKTFSLLRQERLRGKLEDQERRWAGAKAKVKKGQTGYIWPWMGNTWAVQETRRNAIWSQGKKAFSWKSWLEQENAVLAGWHNTDCAPVLPKGQWRPQRACDRRWTCSGHAPTWMETRARFGGEGMEPRSPSGKFLVWTAGGAPDPPEAGAYWVLWASGNCTHWFQPESSWVWSPRNPRKGPESLVTSGGG